jgi:hypothetical protein
MRAFSIGLAGILALGGVWMSWRESRLSAGIDFYQFWAGAQVARDPSHRNLFTEETRVAAAREYLARAITTERSDRMLAAARARPRFEFFSTPFLYTCFGVFGRSYDRDLVIFQVLSLLATVMALLLLGRLAGLTLPQSFLLIAFVLTLFQPLKADVRVGNVNQIQLLMLSAAMVAFERRLPAADLLGGAILGVATLFKPNVALVVPLICAFLVMRRDDVPRLVRVVGGSIAGAGLAVLSSVIYFGSVRPWVEWFSAARELGQLMLSRASGNVAMLLPLIAQWGAVITAIAVILGGAVTLTVTRWNPSADHVPFLVGMGMMIYLMSASLVWLHYLVLALPPAVLLVGRSLSAQRLLGVTALTLIAADPWEKLFQVRTQSAETTIVTTGLLILFATALWRAGSRRKGLLT